jgi:hypothetical protein
MIADMTPLHGLLFDHQKHSWKQQRDWQSNHMLEEDVCVALGLAWFQADIQAHHHNMFSNGCRYMKLQGDLIEKRERVEGS